MRDAGWEFEVVVSGAEELEGHAAGPEWLALENARLKWTAVRALRPREIVLAADTVVWREGIFYGKPRDLTHARAMLADLAGRSHRVVTGVVIGGAHNTPIAFAETTEVSFHPLGPCEIEDYAASIDPLDKAAGYAAQGAGGRIISRVDGPLSNVIGLPVERVTEVLIRLGLSPQRRQA
jgi:septum formation protein